MTNCIIHPVNCPNANTVPAKDRSILLLWPGVLGFVKTKPAALNWTKLWMEKQNFEVEEFETGPDDNRLCELSSVVDRHSVIIADITLRDPQVYFGISLARASLKPTLFIADSRMVGNAFPDLISYQVSDNSETASQDLRVFEEKFKAAIGGLSLKSGSSGPVSAPRIDGNRLQNLFGKIPGDRSANDTTHLQNAWTQILELCEKRLPDQEWALTRDWYKAAHYNRDTGFLTVAPSEQEIAQSKKLLGNPIYRHTLEQAIYDSTAMKNNWIIKIERYTDL